MKFVFFAFLYVYFGFATASYYSYNRCDGYVDKYYPWGLSSRQEQCNTDAVTVGGLWPFYWLARQTNWMVSS